MSAKEKKTKTSMDRREFIKKRAYTAYATPIVLSMLVEKASAAKSWNPGKGELTHTPGHSPVGPEQPRWTKDDNPQ